MSEYCPTQSGTYSGFQPEYEIFFGEWKTVPTEKSSLHGVPPPFMCGGINDTIGLYGYEQAQALAWAYAAAFAAHGVAPRVRVVEYEIEYSIKAKRKEEAKHRGVAEGTR